MYVASQNVPLELEMHVSVGSADPFFDVEPTVVVTGESGELVVPAFWAGDDEFRARVALPAVGSYHFRWQGLPSPGRGPSPDEGDIEVRPYDGSNPLFRHGRIRVRADRRRFEHADGTPFFWLGDTQWQMFTTKFDYPAEFATLESDREQKGFSVVQAVAGPLSGFLEEEAWHADQHNDGGTPWLEGWSTINPAYFDDVDRKVAGLVEHGMVPCLVGMWGYWLPIMGRDRVERHWRYLVARYGALPVVWCLGGEVQMPSYVNQREGGDALIADTREQAEGWTQLARLVRRIDAHRNLITTHPAATDHMPGAVPDELPPGVRTISGSGRSVLLHDDALDFDMLQPGHFGYQMLDTMVDVVNAALRQDPPMPVVNGETNYEGIAGSCWSDLQRFQFWTTMADGAAGYTYGAAGIWQFWSVDSFSKGGDSELMEDAGGGPWQEVMHLPGSTELGIGKRFFESMPWHQFEPISEPEAEKRGRGSSFACGIPGVVSVYYIPSGLEPDHLCGILHGGERRNFWWRLVLPIEVPDGEFEAYWFDPRTGEEQAIGPVVPEDGSWTPPAKPSLLDWVLVVVDRTRMAAIA
jgi:Protein of unknown function (DUF4038)/Domain of unknown function (DUF5060)/Putative collagen-binding domain of a collagenase